MTSYANHRVVPGASKTKKTESWDTEDEIHFLRNLKKASVARYSASLHKRKRWGAIDKKAVKKECKARLASRF